MQMLQRADDSVSAGIRSFLGRLWPGLDSKPVLPSSLSVLPAPLRDRMAESVHRILGSVPVLRDMGDEFIHGLVRELKPVVLTPGEELHIASSDAGLVLVVEGIVEAFFASDGSSIQIAAEGFLGDESMSTGGRALERIRAVTASDVFLLPASTFRRVAEDHPFIGARVRELALNKMREQGNATDDPGLPGFVTGITVTDTRGRREMHWLPVPGASGYQILHRTEDGSWQTLITNKPHAVLPGEIPPFVVRVRAFNNSGFGGIAEKELGPGGV